MWKSVLSWIKQGIWVVFGGLLALVSAPFWSEIRTSIVSTILSKLSSKALLSLAGLLFLVCCLLLVILYEAKSKKWLLAKYEQDPDFLNMLRHKLRHEERVCPKCLTDGLVSPMRPDAEGRYLCSKRNCHEWAESKQTKPITRHLPND